MTWKTVKIIGGEDMAHELHDEDLPQEEPWCETCGWSVPFCTCPDDLKFEEEEEEEE